MVALIIKKYNKRLPGFNSNSLPLQKEVNDDKKLVMENLENARPLQDCRICNERLNEFEEFFNSQKKNHLKTHMVQHGTMEQTDINA